MQEHNTSRWLKLLGIVLLFWVAVRYLLPVTVPFLLGGLLAWGAEPGVRFLQRRLRWHRLPAVSLWQ